MDLFNATHDEWGPAAHEDDEVPAIRGRDRRETKPQKDGHAASVEGDRFTCSCGVTFRFAARGGELVGYAIERDVDPRPCPRVLPALERAGVTTYGARLAVEVLTAEAGIFSGPGVRVTRQGQNPVATPSVEEPQRVDEELEKLFSENLPFLQNPPKRGSRCPCGAERHESDCDLCRGLVKKHGSVENRIERWLAMGSPDDRSYRARFGCTCHCHKGERGLCTCEKPGPDADVLVCMQRRSRAAISGAAASSTKVASHLGPERKPGLLPPMEQVAEPEGPPLMGQMGLCTCECHEERPKTRVARIGKRRLLLPRRINCECPKAGPGARRERQKPESVERKRRRECARLTPPAAAIPPACGCACHFENCCVTETEWVDGPAKGKKKPERVEKIVARNPHNEGGGTLFPKELAECPCREHDPHACALVARGPRILATKVDTLHLSWHAELDRHLFDLLKAKKDEAKDQGGREFVTIRLPGSDVLWRVTTKGGGSIYGYRITNEYADLVLSTAQNREAAQLRFEVRAAWLWERELEGAWEWCRAIAEGLHESVWDREKETWTKTKRERPAKSALTRLDMAIDVKGVDFARAARGDFVTRATKRTRHNTTASEGDNCPQCTGSGVCRCCSGAGVLDEHAVEQIHATLEEHYSGLKESGLSFGHSGIVARIYDKTREIRTKSKDKKWLYLVWATQGWVATETVWRVEIQVRRQELREFVSERTERKLKLDTLEGLRRALPSLWRYSVGGIQGHVAWLKWSVPQEDDERRARWPARPEWALIQEANWSRGEAVPLFREHVRDASFNVLLPQLVGVTRRLAAIAGPATYKLDLFTGEEVQREAQLGDFQRHADVYIVAKRKERYSDPRRPKNARDFWEEWVNEVRVEDGLPWARFKTADEELAAQQAERKRMKERQSRRVAAMSL